MTPRLTARSKAVRMLREKFESGELKGNEDPKTVWLSEETFKQQKLDNFRTRYNKMRKEYLNGAERDEDLNTKCVLDGGNEAKKRRISESMEPQDGAIVPLEPTGGVDAEADEDLAFKPLKMLSLWEEQGSREKRITATIVLPSGVGPGDFSVQVVDEGFVLQLTVKWPTPLIDLEVMHRMWLQDCSQERMLMYHPKMLGFEKALQGLRNNATETIESTARISLPFQVESHIHSKINLAFRDNSTRMLYVNLHAAVEQYAVRKDNEEFVVK